MQAVPLAVSVDPSLVLQLAVLMGLAGAYALRARTVARRARPVPAWRQASFYAALVVIALTLTLLGSPSRKLLYAGTVEQLLIGDLAALLIVLGLTAAVLRPLLDARVGRVRGARVARTLTHPLPAFALWALNLAVWHVPALYEAALGHPAVHAVQHALALGVGVNMWMCLCGPLARPRWFDDRAKLAYVLAVRLCGTALGNVLLWAGTVYYPYYLNDAHAHLSPLADQNIAGAIVLFEQSLTMLALFAWLARRSAQRRAAAVPVDLAGQLRLGTLEAPARQPSAVSATAGGDANLAAEPRR